MVNVDPKRKFIGLDAYQKVLESGVDLVILTTPPGFRPLHFKAAAEAKAAAEGQKRKFKVEGAGAGWRRNLKATAECVGWGLVCLDESRRA